jgi:hypothetical protein
MDRTRADILGDVFQGAITYGEAGQFLTPEPVCDLMARMTLEPAGTTGTDRKTILDPCCGSGRMLLAAANVRPNCEFVGQDIDLRCVRMTAINLALRNLYGQVIWGNSLAGEYRLGYRTGFNLRGFVRELTVDESATTTRAIDQTAGDLRTTTATSPALSPGAQPGNQLYLF